MNIIVGGSGSGTLTLNSGAVSMPATSGKSLTIANGLGSSGTVNLNGGTMTVSNVVKLFGSPATFNFNGGTFEGQPKLCGLRERSGRGQCLGRRGDHQ